MLSPIHEHDLPEDDGNGRARWKLSDLVIPLAVLTVLRCLMLVDRQWINQVAGTWVVVPVFILFCLCLLLYPLLLARRRGLAGNFRPPPLKTWLREAIIAIPVCAVFIVVYVAVCYLISLVMPESVPNWYGMVRLIYYSIMLILAFTLAPVAEEVFFRGFLHNVFRARMPLVVAAVLQSLIFAGLHIRGAWDTAAVFLAGLVLTAVYEWRKSLLAPIFVHSGLNFTFAAMIVWVMIASANAPVLGVSGEDHPKGCLVTKVFPDSAAAKAQFVEGDIIVQFDGQPIDGFLHLAETMHSYEVGDVVVIGVIRDAMYVEIEVILQGRREPD